MAGNPPTDQSSVMKDTVSLLKELTDAYEQKDFDRVGPLAEDGLRLAAEDGAHWNAGNTIHVVHTITGLVALHHGNLGEARQALLRSASTSGSPQLKSFGPNMRLAKELLLAGEKTIVLDYFEAVKKFWPAFFSFFKLRKWSKQVRNGEMPDFKASLNYHLGTSGKA